MSLKVPSDNVSATGMSGLMGIPAVWFDAEVIYLLSLTANNLNILNNLRWIQL
jgi:hypothetical protein